MCIIAWGARGNQAAIWHSVVCSVNNRQGLALYRISHLCCIICKSIAVLDEKYFLALSPVAILVVVVVQNKPEIWDLG